VSIRRRLAEERQLILLSAATAASREQASGLARRLSAEIDWPRLAEVLARRKLLQTLGPRIQELAGERADAGFEAALQRALELGRRQGAFLQLISSRVMATLAEAGIRSATLKGPSLGEAIYGDPGRRPSSDVDLLVAADQLPAAVEAVRGMGYVVLPEYVDARGLPLLHFALVHEQGQLPPVELHWRVHWYEEHFARERLLPPTLEAQANWRPEPPDELAALLLFYARDGFIDLRLACDLGAWWDVHGADLPPAALDGLLDAHPALVRATATALEVAEAVVGMPAGPLLGSRRKRSARERAAARLANPNPHTSRSQLHADAGLIDGLLAPPGGFGAFVRRQVLPPHEVLAQQARHADRRRPRSRLTRSTGVLARYARAMARMVRTPERTL
jgi:hypothetical protein